MTGHPITPEHLHLLEAAAIDPVVAVEAGVRSVTELADLPEELSSWRSHPGIVPGIVFPATGPDGDTSVQYRPDVAVHLEGEERERKYLFAKGATPVVNMHPRMVRLVTDPVGTVLVVEGTKQHLAAVSYADDDVLVVGIAGCNGWRSEGVPLPGWNHLPIDGAEVVVAFDADLATNRAVHDAGAALAEHLELLGASNVRFLTAPTGAKAGLDDYLASIGADQRRRVLRKLVRKAGPIPKAPPKRKAPPAVDDIGAAYFDRNGLRALDLVAAVLDGAHYALGPDGSVWTYAPDLGIYVDDEHALVAATRDRLGNRWRRMHHATVLELLAAELAAQHRRLPDAPIGRLVAVTNGMLDVRTGELHPHDPAHFAYARLTVPWDPTATCPRFDAWLAEQAGSQADDLLEALGLVLVPWVGQRKVPFLIGPTRSGKGTVMRIIEALLSAEHRSAVTLHDLATNRFAAAQLHGKALNSAGDLSDHHVADLSLFKMLTGDDAVSGERKFRDAFVFRNTALFMFNANTPPTVSENSRAYLARVRPFLFPHSFEGAEDASIEVGLLEELPGILVRLVEGVQRFLERGGYAPVNPIVADLFARQSDPVALFLAQVLEPAEGEFVSTTDVHNVYKLWTVANDRGTLGRNKMLGRVDNALGPRQRERTDNTGARGWRGWRILPESSWGDDDTTYAACAASVGPVTASSANFSPTSPHEESFEVGEEEPREGEVGRELAEVAVGAADLSDDVLFADPDNLADEDPDAIGTVLL